MILNKKTIHGRAGGGGDASPMVEPPPAPEALKFERENGEKIIKLVTRTHWFITTGRLLHKRRDK